MFKVLRKKPIDTDVVNDISSKLGISKTLIEILYSNRDIELNEKSISKELDLYTNCYSDLSKLIPCDGLDKSSELITNAIKNNKNILVLTDYDCDGMNSAAVIYKILDLFRKDYEFKFTVKVNKRTNGNGLTEKLIKSIDNIDQYDLLLTADHGSSDGERLLELSEKMDIVVTDHHKVKDNFPIDKITLINPLKVNGVEETGMSGCLVAFVTLLHAYYKVYDIKETEKEEVANWLLTMTADNIALTVLSDVMNVTDEYNRYIISVGLDKINSNNRSIFKELSRYIGLGDVVTPSIMRYNFSPTINAGNRMHCEDEVFSFLLSDCQDISSEEFNNRLDFITELNKNRKTLTNTLLDKILNSDRIRGEYSCVIGLNTDYGINGILASKIGEIYKRPSVCFIGDDILHGSCRSIIEELDMVKILNILHEEEIVDGYGGHKNAAGCQIKRDNYDVFCKRFDELVKDELGNIKIEKDVVYVDSIIPSEEMTQSIVLDIEMLEPYGKGFDVPSLYTELIVHSVFKTDAMTFVTLGNDLQRFNAVYFNNNKFNPSEVFIPNSKVGIVFNMGLKLTKNIYGSNIVITNAKIIESKDEMLLKTVIS